MGPAQLCTQRVHNLGLRTDLGGQLGTQCGHNLPSVLRPLLLQDVRSNALADLPVKQHQRGVDALRHRLARGENQCPNLGKQCGPADGFERSSGIPYSRRWWPRTFRFGCSVGSR